MVKIFVLLISMYYKKIPSCLKKILNCLNHGLTRIKGFHGFFFKSLSPFNPYNPSQNLLICFVRSIIIVLRDYKEVKEYPLRKKDEDGNLRK